MNSFDRFLNASAEEKLAEFRSRQDEYWTGVGRTMAFELFRTCAERVPAYQDFLAKNGVDPESIVTPDDLEKLPITDKHNYISQYPLEQLCLDGKIEPAHMISSSSGTTGQSAYWPQSDVQTLHEAEIVELLYREILETGTRSTLFVNALSLGMWSAGTAVLQHAKWISLKGHRITMINPGMDVDGILQGIGDLHAHFEQVVLIGYPPFIKNVIDEGTQRGIAWNTLNVRLLLTGEALTERTRDYMTGVMGKSVYTDCINMFGSADAGIMGHETPLTIYLRRKAAGDRRILSALFGSERVPSVNQYNPRYRHFEEVQGHLILTTRSGIPLIRYDTQDLGGILSYGEIEQRMAATGTNLAAALEHENLEQKIWKIPVVYLFGRGKFSATICGILIYPEHMKQVLDAPALQGIVTGQYRISTEENSDGQQELQIVVELANGVAPLPEYQERIVQTFVEELPKICTEYHELVKRVGRKAYPVVSVVAFGDPERFPKGVMHKGA